MDDGPQNIEVFPDHFEASTPPPDCLQKGSPKNSQSGSNCSLRCYGDSCQPIQFRKVLLKSFLWFCGFHLVFQCRSHRHSLVRRRLMTAASMLNLFNLPGLPWGSSGSGDEKVELTAAELESLRSEIADAEDREAHLKAQLEHIDEILRSARLAGYLYIRNRWTALPGEPPIDDSDVDDWLPRFVVLHGTCIFFYSQSTDLSPLDSTLLSDVVEVGRMPSFLQEDQQMRYSFYILTCHGLRFECSSLSEVQVDSWLVALRSDCNLDSGTSPKDPPKS